VYRYKIEEVNKYEKMRQEMHGNKMKLLKEEERIVTEL
jgi:hypothetical protein